MLLNNESLLNTYFLPTVKSYIEQEFFLMEKESSMNFMKWEET